MSADQYNGLHSVYQDFNMNKNATFTSKEVFANLEKSAANFLPPQTKTAGINDLTQMNINQMRNNMNVYQNPSRRFYDPTLSNTALLLPKQLRQKNKWYRWYFDHDEVIGAVLELHSELPYSAFELELDDPFILREFQDCVEDTQIESQLPIFDLEFMKIGEVFPQSVWDDTKGRWSHIFALNPDFVNVTFSPFVENGSTIELIPDDDLKNLVNSTRIEDQELKKKLPPSIVSRVLTGRNILLDADEITHIARRSSPYDARGSSMLGRILRTLIYDDKLKEAQQTICDNFIYPLKLFLLGDKAAGWIPSVEHQNALAQMLQQAAFDPNFSLIYHYALDVKYITVADKLLNVAKEFEDIDKRKMAALGIPASFITGESNFSSMNVGLQTQLARYKAKRDMFETKLIKKNFITMAKRNEWYVRDKKELAFNFRVKRTAAENKDRLQVPDILWHRKLSLREDQNYLTFLNNVYNSGKGIVSPITMLRAMGLDATEELKRKRKGKDLENRIGEKLNMAAAAAGGTSGGMGGPGGVTAAIKGLVTKFGKHSVPEIKHIDRADFFTKELEEKSAAVQREKEVAAAKVSELQKEFSSEKVDINYVLSTFKFASESEWLTNLKSPRVSGDVVLAFMDLKDSLDAIHKKYSTFKVLDDVDFTSLLSKYKHLYLLGKSNAKSIFNTDVITASIEDNQVDYSDVVLLNEFSDWIKNLPNIKDTSEYIKLLRSFGNSCFAYGQLKCYAEYGIKGVKLANVMSNRGVSFDIDSLLSYRCGMSCIVSPDDEIMLFTPRIEHMYYSQYDDSVKILAEPSELYKNFTYKDIQVKNCPIEYVPDLRLVLSNLYNSVNKLGSVIEFTHDITGLPEWQQDTRDRLEKEFKNEAENERSFIVNAHFQVEKSSKSQSMMMYKSGKTIYVNNAIDALSNRFITSFLSNLDITTSDIKKNISKYENKISLDLSKDDVNSFLASDQIIEVRDDNDDIQYYRISSVTTDNKLKMGKVWDKSGKSITSDRLSVGDIFNRDLPLYLEFPHRIDGFSLELFEEILE